jgi:hypothetical protein
LWWRENWPTLVPDLFVHQTSNNATLLHGDDSLFSTNVIDDIPWYPISRNLLNSTSLNIYKYTWALCCYPTSDDFLSYYAPIWLSISHHYLILVNINIMDMKRHILICFVIFMLLGMERAEIVIKIRDNYWERSEVVWLKSNSKVKKVNHFLPQTGGWWCDVTVHEHVDHALLEIVCLFVLFYACSSPFMEKGECKCLVWRKLASCVWFLFFMISCEIKVPIGGLDCTRMMSCCYLKVIGFCKTPRKAKYSMIELCS